MPPKSARNSNRCPREPHRLQFRPLIALGILGKLELLQTLFDEVLVPDAVPREIVQGGVKLAGLENFQRAQWIRVLPPKQNDALLAALLDTGEAAVIALAREQGIPVCVD